MQAEAHFHCACNVEFREPCRSRSVLSLEPLAVQDRHPGSGVAPLGPATRTGSADSITSPLNGLSPSGGLTTADAWWISRIKSSSFAGYSESSEKSMYMRAPSKSGTLRALA